jgi:hypothetical protein
MRILSVVRHSYYGNTQAIEPMAVYFTVPLRKMGHEVATFDHYEACSRLGREHATAELVAAIQRREFDAIFYQTSGSEPIDTSALAGLSRQFCIAAWNSDDDWQWPVTSRIAAHFTFMITTYPHILDENRAAYPNLLLSQWGCPGQLGNTRHAKDIPFSFVGSIYGPRYHACRYLRRRANLACYGRGSKLVKLGIPYFRGALCVPWLAAKPLQLDEVHEIWNRTLLSYTPLESSSGGNLLQIKGRLFEMGLSGAVPLCQRCSQLDPYYRAGHEILTFESLEDCAEKAAWYLAHQSELARIASRYRERTLREHMWEHRFDALFAQMGLRASSQLCSA